MSKRLQFAAWLLALGFSVIAILPAEAQNRPPKNQPQSRQQQQQRQQQRQEKRDAGRNTNPNRPPVSQSAAPNTNRPPERARNQQNRPPSANTPPRNFNNLNPQEKQRALDNYRNYQKL